MNFLDVNQVITSDKLSLNPISLYDKEFFLNAFQDSDIAKYYIVPKDAQQDYRKLVDYWLTDIKNSAGTCWKISLKENGLFSNDKHCGFIAFEFQNTLSNARISYALLPAFRKKGIAIKAAEMVITRLKENGVISIEADIDRDNLNSEKVVEKLGFTADKSRGLIDPEMLRDGEIRIRVLWKKNLLDVIEKPSIEKITINATIEKLNPIITELVKEINSKGQQPTLMYRYFYLLGRIKFIEGNYGEARSAFGECNYSVMGNKEITDSHISCYWLGKINNLEGKSELAKDCFQRALKSFNPKYLDITESDILKAIEDMA